MSGVCAKEEPIGNRNQLKGKRDKENQIRDNVQNVAHNAGKHRIDNIHGDIGFPQEAKGADQDDVAAEAHHDHIHRPDLRAVQDTAHKHLENNNCHRQQRNERENTACPFRKCIDALADDFDCFH